MTEWQEIASAPRDELLILYGLIEPHPSDRHLYGSLDRPTRVIGYWCDIDEAWAIHGGTWLGPWFKPSHWQLVPTPPSFTSTPSKPMREA